MIRHSIRTKLILLLLAAMAVPILISMVISYFYTKNSVTADVIRQTRSNLALGKQNLINYMNAINQSSLLIYTGINQTGSLYTLLEDHRDSTLDANGVPSTPPLPSQTLRMEMQTMLRSVEELYKIHLHTPQNQYSYLMVNDFYRSRSNPNYVVPSNTIQPYIEPPHVSHNYGMGNLLPYRHEEIVMTFHRPIIRTPYEDILGYLAIDYKMDLIRSIGEQMMPDGESMFYILNENSTIMYGPDPNNWGEKYGADSLVSQIRNTSEENGFFTWKDNAFSGYVFFEKLDTLYMNWVIVKLIPYEQLTAGAKAMTRINSWLFGVFLIIAVLLMLYITMRFTSTIKRLLGYVSKIESGNLQVDIEINGKDELSLLARRFRGMMQTINELIDREYKLKIANTTNQLKALQAQINPHFMYNALQSIATTALRNKDEQTYALITTLGKMMRYAMQTEHSIVTLKQEIDYCAAYLKLQKQRFGDTFQFTIHVEEQSLPVRIPRMILQPIVENCFKHAFTTPDHQAFIRIASWCDENMLNIEVTDNGKGMSNEQMKHLMKKITTKKMGNIEGMENPDANETQIGLSNVLTRLQLQVDPACRLSIEGQPSGGLKVTLYIPLRSQLAQINHKEGEHHDESHHN